MKTTSTPLVALALAALFVTGCSTETGTANPAPASQDQTTSAVSPSEWASIEAEAGLPPAPDAATAADYIAALQEAGVIDPEVATEPLVRMLSVFTIGLLHAPGTLGATTDDQLRETVGLFADLVGRGLATQAPPDAAAARRAQLALLDNLDAQLDHLEEIP